ncbi:MAG: hypothetical protein MJA30_10085 [Cytophagales bacterium]|nr:hypothetical protein [Cytophagales bacterium]
MMTKTSKAPENDMVRVTHHVDRVNLYDFGYEQSGTVKGDPDMYIAYLDRIVNGDLVDTKYHGFSDEERVERVKQVKELEKELEEAEKTNEQFDQDIKKKEGEIDEYRQEMLNIREIRAKDNEKLKAESFSVVKFSINVFLLVMLSVYLFFFYISAAYKALYVDFEGIAESIAEGVGVGSIMPGAYELSEALQFNYLLLLVPFVFYAFGWAFHILLELKSKYKFIFLTLLITVTFMVDFLLALIIHNNTESAKELMGLATIPWSQSSTFYIILFLGFLVYIIWSILFDSLLREWDKRHITGNLKKIIKHLERDIKTLRSRRTDTVVLQNKINDYREDASVVMYGDLKRYIDQFSSGWISYLSPANMKDVKESCLILKKEFEEKNDIKKGIVKVANKRR